MPISTPQTSAPTPTPGWTFAGAAAGGEPFAIDGVDVFRHEWKAVAGAPAIDVRDPHYGQPYRMPVYRVVDGPRAIVFAAGEFSNSVWGFYIPVVGPSAAVTMRPPPLPASRMPGRSLARRLAPYAPLAAAIVEVPWVVLLVMMAMGTRENATGPNPYWEREFSAAAIVPAAVGLLCGIAVIVGGLARGWLARVALALGCVACAAIVYSFGKGMFAPLQ